MLVNVTCQIRLTRQVPTGLLKIKADIIGIDEVFIRFSMYYRYTGGFRQYLFDTTVNGCEFVKQTKFIINNAAINRLASGAKEVFPTLFNGCPYKVILTFGSYTALKFLFFQLFTTIYRVILNRLG